VTGFRDTLEYAGLLEGNKLKLSKGEQEADLNASMTHTASPGVKDSWQVPKWPQAGGIPVQTSGNPVVIESVAGVTTFRDLPITLPSNLDIAVLRVPVPMTPQDFKTLVNTLNAMEKSLVRQDQTGG
jgi:hypothetical protein